jgi:hypothetical protein
VIVGQIFFYYFALSLKSVKNKVLYSKTHGFFLLVTKLDFYYTAVRSVNKWVAWQLCCQLVFCNLPLANYKGRAFLFLKGVEKKAKLFFKQFLFY